METPFSLILRSYRVLPQAGPAEDLARQRSLLRSVTRTGVTVELGGGRSMRDSRLLVSEQFGDPTQDESLSLQANTWHVHSDRDIAVATI